MATAHGIVILQNRPEKFSVTARVIPEGTGNLYLKGKVADTFPKFFGPVIHSIRQMQDFLDCPNLDCADIALRLDTPHNYPIAGGSYALTFGIAILAAATNKIIPADNCYTGCITGTGKVEEVDFIAEKRRGAAGFDFKRLFLPKSQIDMFSTYIAQCPCGTLADAYGITFWNER